MKKVLHYAWAMLRLTWWRLRGYRTLVSVAQQESRAMCCHACAHRRADECGLCGCPIDSKSPLASERCPKGFWLAIRVKK